MMSYNDLKAKLVEATDIREYLRILNEIKKYDVAIILAVRDTPGNCMADDVLEAIHNLGFHSFSKELWRMYIGINVADREITDCLSDAAEEKLHIQADIDETKVDIRSESWRNGNIAEIKINGSDYSRNLRGVNIVVFSKNEKRVIDSVGYDSHEETDFFSRKDLSSVVQEHYDVGIFGWWYNANYGANLTYFALNRAIQNMGKSVIMLWRAVIQMQPREEDWQRFADTYYHVSPYISYDQLRTFNNYCDAFILGSDQLWNPALGAFVDSQFYLDFVEAGKNKIAYAQSFGNEGALPIEWIQAYGRMIWNIHRVSVREDYAMNMCKRDLGIDVIQVCDPVFLVEPTQFNELLENADIELPEHYLLSFLLDPTHEKLEISDTIQNGLRLSDIVYFTDLDGAEEREKNFEGRKVELKSRIENLVKAYQKADFVFTDSFHGTCLAIIFNKPFISFANEKRGTGRFQSLIREFRLENRLIRNKGEVGEKYNVPIDFTYPNSQMGKLRKEGLEWLKKSLFVTKAVNVTCGSDRCTGCAACANICPTDAIEMKPNYDGFYNPSVDYDKCVNCGKCTEVCPALKISGETVRKLGTEIPPHN